LEKLDFLYVRRGGSDLESEFGSIFPLNASIDERLNEVQGAAEGDPFGARVGEWPTDRSGIHQEAFDLMSLEQLSETLSPLGDTDE
jgi:hypothetical protein